MADAKIPDIGKYHIIELVGEGAMGVVYRAVDSVLNRTVAIKVMNESIARHEELRKRFLHEAQAAASLQHPNVVCIYDLGEVDGHLFIAMEFVPGVNLERLMELGEPLSLQAKLDIAIDILTGLTFAHKRGIVHRDIKPANIQVAEDGRAKIMDFGVAHLASSNLTSTGASLGTPGYMAPEQIIEGKTTPATDIFAVGVVLYELLTRVNPFEGSTLQNLFYKIISEKPRPVSEIVPGLPPALDRIVAKALAKEPSDRYSNALDMANELTGIRGKLSGPAYPSSVSLSATVEHAIALSRKSSRARTQNRSIAGAGALVVLVAVVSWATMARSRGEIPTRVNSATPISESASSSSAVAELPAAAKVEQAASAPAVTPPRVSAPSASAPPPRKQDKPVATERPSRV
ncbi:MAG: protein kinase, partial [Gemmatimonadetes bacterium]|nr:protein kinase [Gemmatimonadota bacterium]